MWLGIGNDDWACWRGVCGPAVVAARQREGRGWYMIAHRRCPLPQNTLRCWICLSEARAPGSVAIGRLVRALRRAGMRRLLTIVARCVFLVLWALDLVASVRFLVQHAQAHELLLLV